MGGMEPETTTEDLVNESPDADDGQPVYGDLEDIEPYAEATEAAEGWSDEKEEGDG